MAGLALTSHTKAYAQTPNCGGGSSGVGVVRDEPIVCDSRVTRTLNSSGGKGISINMDRRSGEAAVTVKNGADITIGKKITVTGGSGSLPVIKVYGGGKLMLDQEVDVTKATIKKEIVVEGAGSSVTLKGVLKGFERMEISNGGMVVLGEKVTGIEGMKVKINDGGGTVRLMKDVTFNNGTEAGIKIEGNRAGKASVIGVGKTVIVKGSGIEVDGNGGTASVVMLTIVGTGSTGVGVDVQNGRGEMTLNKVGIEGFRVGVNAMSGTVNINGNSTIEVIAGGTGIMVGSGATVKMMEGSIKGGGGLKGVESSGVVELTKVDISKFGKGVDVTAGTLKMMGGTVTFEDGKNNYGVHVQNGATADLTKVTIKGTGSGQGVGVIKDGAGTMTMTEVGISGVKVGVHAKNGKVNINMGEITFEGNGQGVKVETGAVADLTKVTIKGGGATGTGLYVMGTA
ncbi:hypothetical protein, partial [Bartonella bovis]|uniref:hypothetical protein n=1 Tax=Bartonella bovis TaxID=155194 RepID=UPI0011AF8D34